MASVCRSCMRLKYVHLSWREQCSLCTVLMRHDMHARLCNAGTARAPESHTSPTSSSSCHPAPPFAVVSQNPYIAATSLQCEGMRVSVRAWYSLCDCSPRCPYLFNRSWPALDPAHAFAGMQGTAGRGTSSCRQTPLSFCSAPQMEHKT